LKKAFVETYRVSKTFNAPLDFVYRWCTDYREDDLKMIGSSNKRKIIERSKSRVVWRVIGKNGGNGYEGVRVVWLKPPNSWHLDTCGDKRELGEYRLTPLGKGRTRLDMKFTVSYDSPKEVEGRKSWEADARADWDSYGSYLERDYRRSLRA